MAKIKHASVIDTIDQIVKEALDKKIVHLSADKVLSGRKLIVHDKKVINFGNCNYLGLEQHPKVKAAAIQAIEEEGIRLTMSRSYMSSNYYTELEDLLSQIYGGHTIVLPSVTMLHLSSIPILFGREDLVILDQQVHTSVNQAVQYTKSNGLTVKTLRHNRLDILEQFIQKYQDKYKKIWYAGDGIYSMFGDASDIHALYALLEKYPNFHLYIDDAHGSSWIGEHGKGYILDQVPLHSKMIITQSLGKAYGVLGGVLVTKDPELCRRVKNCGGTLIFSNPLSSSSLGAAVASAKIHLSDELAVYQKDLMDKIKYCNQLMKEYELPLVKDEDTPIFFVACGLPKVAYSMINLLMEEGFLANIGIFPAVPLKCAGVRILMTCHLEKEDILALVKCIKKHLSRVMAEENFTYKELAKAFGKPEFERLAPKASIVSTKSTYEGLKLEKFNSITEVDKEAWEYLMHNKGAYDVSTLKMIEEIYQNNELPENNWKFIYYMIKDKENQIVFASFFTVSLWKEDLLSPPSISKDLEAIRATEDPYFLISQSLSMGCQALEGEPCFIDTNHPLWKKSINLLLQDLWEEQDKEKAELIVLRDINANQTEIINIFKEKGFVSAEMPDTHIIEDLNWDTIDEYLSQRSPRSRKHIRKFALNKEHWFDVKIVEEMDSKLAAHLHQLYLNVKKINFAINTFELPKHFIETAAQDPQTRIFTITPNENSPTGSEEMPVSFCYSRYENGIYHALFVGLNYDFLHSHSIYRQTILQIVKDAKKMDCHKINIGFSATIEKKKFGAVPYPVVALVQTKDNYNQTTLNNMSVTKLAKHY